MLTVLLTFMAFISSIIDATSKLLADRKFVLTIPQPLRQFWFNYIYFASPLPFLPYWGFFKNQRSQSVQSASVIDKALMPDYAIKYADLKDIPFALSTWLVSDIQNKRAFGTSEFAYKSALKSKSKTAYKALKRCFKVGCRFSPYEFHEHYRAAKKIGDYSALEKWLTDEYNKKVTVNTYLLNVLLGTFQRDFPEGFEKIQKFLDVKNYSFLAELKEASKFHLDTILKVVGVAEVTNGVENLSGLTKEQLFQIAGAMALTPEDVTKMLDAGFLDSDDVDDLNAGLIDLNAQYGMTTIDKNTGTKSGLLADNVKKPRPFLKPIVNPKDAKEFKLNNRDQLKKPRTIDFKSLLLLLLPFGSVVLVGYLVYKFIIKK